MRPSEPVVPMRVVVSRPVQTLPASSGHFARRRRCAEVRENSIDHRRVGRARHDLHGAVAGRARTESTREDVPQHCRTTAGDLARLQPWRGDDRGRRLGGCVLGLTPQQMVRHESKEWRRLWQSGLVDATHRRRGIWHSRSGTGAPSIRPTCAPPVTIALRNGPFRRSVSTTGLSRRRCRVARGSRAHSWRAIKVRIAPSRTGRPGGKAEPQQYQRCCENF